VIKSGINNYLLSQKPNMQHFGVRKWLRLYTHYVWCQEVVTDLYTRHSTKMEMEQTMQQMLQQLLANQAEMKQKMDA
jgi:hypothetical protein